MRRTVRFAIIVMIQCALPLLFFWLVVPLLFNQTELFNQIQCFFHKHRVAFLLSHLFFYGAFYSFWPLFIRWMSRQHNPSILQMKTAISARGYLVATMAFFELLMGWR